MDKQTQITDQHIGALAFGSRPWARPMVFVGVLTIDNRTEASVRKCRC